MLLQVHDQEMKLTYSLRHCHIGIIHKWRHAKRWLGVGLFLTLVHKGYFKWVWQRGSEKVQICVTSFINSLLLRQDFFLKCRFLQRVPTAGSHAVVRDLDNRSTCPPSMICQGLQTGAGAGSSASHVFPATLFWMGSLTVLEWCWKRWSIILIRIEVQCLGLDHFWLAAEQLLTFFIYLWRLPEWPNTIVIFYSNEHAKTFWANFSNFKNPCERSFMLFAEKAVTKKHFTLIIDHLAFSLSLSFFF